MLDNISVFGNVCNNELGGVLYYSVDFPVIFNFYLLSLLPPPSLPPSFTPSLSPQDVLATLLNNLKVQERQNRVCTTVAIAIVAETCAPFTVLPALMNEYRVPELNVQNGVLKSLSFLFEYIGEMGKDYIYAVTPLLEDALMDR